MACRVRGMGVRRWGVGSGIVGVDESQWGLLGGKGGMEWYSATWCPQVSLLSKRKTCRSKERSRDTNQPWQEVAKDAYALWEEEEGPSPLSSFCPQEETLPRRQYFQSCISMGNCGSGKECCHLKRRRNGTLAKLARFGAAISTPHEFLFRWEKELSREFWGVIFLTKILHFRYGLQSPAAKGSFKK